MIEQFTVEEIEALLPFVSKDERKFLLEHLARDSAVWRPFPGPQFMAYHSKASVIGYGGAAGGGKTDLGIGLALTKHHKTLFVRQHATELTGLYDRLADVLGRRDFQDQRGTWRVPGGPYNERHFRFGSLANPGDETKEMGKEKDLLVLEEAANMMEAQARFVTGWVRSARGVPTQVLMTFNPPTTSEGRWIISYFAPWLDQRHLAPADPGELRWFVGTRKNPDYEVPDDQPRVEIGGRLVTNFNPTEHKREDILKPRSRTFIPARVVDNPSLAGTEYMANLQALPEPLRSQMLYGDFTAGIKDDEWQVIPTKWVEIAVQRWAAAARVVKPRMDSVGVDVARGGDDNTVIARLHEGNWFDEPIAYPATQTPDGPAVAGLAVAARRDLAPIHLEITGVGSSPYDFLNRGGFQVIGVNPAERAPEPDKSGLLGFVNVRSWMWWKMREALDPNANNGIALPPDKRLIADLTTPRWELRGKNVYVESREDLLKPTRLGRSPDWGTAYVLAWIRTPRMSDLQVTSPTPAHSYDPYAHLATDNTQTRRDYNPY